MKNLLVRIFGLMILMLRKISETNNIEVQELIKLNSILIIDLILLASLLHFPSDDKLNNLKYSSECHLVNLLFSMSAKQLVRKQTDILSVSQSFHHQKTLS